MVEPTVVRFYASVVVAEAIAVVLVALWWQRTRRRVNGKPRRWTIGRLYPRDVPPFGALPSSTPPSDPNREGSGSQPRRRYHTLVFASRQEAAAFVAALSRYLSSPHGQAKVDEAIEVWLETAVGDIITLCLSTAALGAARAAFGALPVDNERDQGPTSPPARLVINEATGEAWGLLEATRHLFGDDGGVAA
jgi:hypothetical protein